MKNVLFLMVLTTFLMGDTELVYPWVTNNSLFKSKVIIVNIHDQEAQVELTAIRADGTTQVVQRTIEAFSQMVESTDLLFDQLGEGPGYAVTLRSSSDDLSGAMVVSGTGSSSGDSPAQANPQPSTLGSMILLFSYLPIPDDPVAASAQVVVNVGNSDAEVHFFAFQDGFRIESDTVLILPPGTPYAALTSDMFPDLLGDIYVVASADQPLLGMAFLFNSFREPSMARALPLAQLPQGTEGETFTYSFADDVWGGIIQSRCAISGCHGNGSVSAGLNMDFPNMYNNTVNVQSTEDVSRFRIKPGDAVESYLYRKLDQTLSNSGATMPRIGPPLTDSELEIIRTWINEGAPNN